MALAAQETTTWPDLDIRTHILARGMAGANLSLQLHEWAYEDLFTGAVLDHNTGAQLEYRDLIKNPELREQWIQSLANKLGWLSQGICNLKGTNTIFFIPKSEVPFNRRKDVTYARIVVAYTPDKLEKNRSRVTVGGDRLTVLIDCSVPTVDLPTIKCLWNSVLSTPGAKYFTMDVSNFYLGSPMERPEFMRMPIKIVPQEIIDQYNLLDIVDDGWVYVRIERGMYGLPQGGKLANNFLVE